MKLTAAKINNCKFFITTIEHGCVATLVTVFKTAAKEVFACFAQQVVISMLTIRLVVVTVVSENIALSIGAERFGTRTPLEVIDVSVTFIL